ncbi:hypothetical protein Vadar_000582 [Vaccinium darrowii]|uniref:Uncharacterized protein n=1 Tax=Vaccinium darrowii TaxID=229202 RepID=A0ACB7XWE2_9ERIC|nr:hypothetical protein Vadar_000582 [Vaccinium darrowii]
MPFGNGVPSCPGSELAKLEMLILLHHLTTSYRDAPQAPSAGDPGGEGRCMRCLKTTCRVYQIGHCCCAIGHCCWVVLTFGWLS